MSSCNFSIATSSGCMTQLGAVGAADAMLTCNPESTLFYQSYKRITNFAAGEATLLVSNAPSGSAGWVTVMNARSEIQRLGDLLGPVFLQACLHGLRQDNNTPQVNAIPVYLWTQAVGFALLQKSRCRIGNQRFEDISSEYMMALDEVTRPEGNRASRMVGDYGPYLRGCAVNSGLAGGNLLAGSDIADEATLQRAIDFSSRKQIIHVPIPHFWTSHPSNFINLVGMQYHTVDLEMEFRSSADLLLSLIVDRSTGALVRDSDVQITNVGEIEAVQIVATYVQLDTAERKARAQSSQTVRMVYCQEQIVATTESDADATKEIRNFFNHPVEQLLWAWRSSECDLYWNAKEYFVFGGYAGGVSLIAANPTPEFLFAQQEVVPESTAFELTINSHSRFSGTAEYFLSAQPYVHNARQPTRMIYSYSFGWYPDDLSMHSGSMNFSRIDNVLFMATYKKTTGAGDPDVLGQLNVSAGPPPRGRYVPSVGLTEIPPLPLPTGMTGKQFLWARTINFYKVSGGMASLLFGSGS